MEKANTMTEFISTNREESIQENLTRKINK